LYFARLFVSLPKNRIMERKDKDLLVTQNMGYVVTLARQYKSDIMSTDDLVSEGAIGMMKAAERFDPSRGKPFVTFAAPYVRSAIEAAIRHAEPDVEIRSTDESLPVNSKNNFTLLNVLEDHDAPRADLIVERTTLSDEFVDNISLLTERQQAVVIRYYGIGCARQSMIEIAMELGLKRERVRQIRDQAVRKLKKITQAKQ